MNGTAFLLAAALLVARCPAPLTEPERDLLAAARAALEQIDPKAELIVVLPESASPSLRRVVSALRSTIDESEVAETEGASFPARHLRIDRLEVSGDTASFAALLGPVPKAKAGEILLDCGTRYSFQLTKEAGAWKVGLMSVAVC